MKKLLALIAGVALISGVASAQTNTVLSRNAVGYIKQDMVRSNLYLMAHQFLSIDGGPVTVTNLLGQQLPPGTFVFVYDVSNQQYRTEQRIGSAPWWLPGTNRLTPGRGFWVRVPGGAASNVYPTFLMGEVPDRTTLGTNTLAIQPGLNMVGLGYPISTHFTNTAIGRGGAVGDFVFFYDPVAGYRNIQRVGPGWLPSTNILKAGEGFFYRRGAAAGSTNWIEPKPYTWP